MENILLEGGGGGGNGNTIGSKELGQGLGYIGAPTPNQLNNLDTSNIFNHNTLARLQTRKEHLDYWLRTTQQTNSVVFVILNIVIL